MEWGYKILYRNKIFLFLSALKLLFRGFQKSLQCVCKDIGIQFYPAFWRAISADFYLLIASNTFLSLSLGKKGVLLFSQTCFMKVFCLILSWYSWNTFVSLKAIFLHLGFSIFQIQHLETTTYLLTSYLFELHVSKLAHFFCPWISSLVVLWTLSDEFNCWYWSRAQAKNLLCKTWQTS